MACIRRDDDSWADLFDVPDGSMLFGANCLPSHKPPPPESRNPDPHHDQAEPQSTQRQPLHLGPVQTDIAEGQHFVADYFLDKKIAGGAFGKVYAARSFRNEKFAIKKLPKEERHMDSIDQEVGLLQRFSGHPNMIAFHGVVHTSKNIYLVMEMATMDVADLLGLAHTIRQPLWRQQILQGVLAALAHLHENGVYHLDLKPENVLLVLEWTKGSPLPCIAASQVRLADFGLSTCKPTLPRGAYVGSIGFMAPELVLRKGGSAGAADVWSLGCILLELSEHLPWNWGRSWYIQNELESFLSDKNSQGEPGSDESLYKDFLFNNMLTIEPSDRSSPNTLLDHAWLQTSYPFHREAGQIL